MIAPLYEGNKTVVYRAYDNRSIRLLGSARRISHFFLMLAEPLVQVVADIHRVGIIHRDLNPQNIVFDPDSDQVKLIDFELSLLSDHGPSA